MPPNYGAVERWNKDDDNDEDVALLDHERAALLTNQENEHRNNSRKQKGWLAALLGLLGMMIILGLILVLVLWMNTTPSSSSSSSSSSSIPSASTAAEEQTMTTTSSVSSEQTASISSFLLDPVHDLKVIGVDRTERGIPQSTPSAVLTANAQLHASQKDHHRTTSTGPLPTNRWYLNLLSHNSNTESNRVYTTPYIMDTTGPIPGIRLHWPTLFTSSNRNMQMVVNAANGLTMGYDRIKKQKSVSPTGTATDSEQDMKEDIGASSETTTTSSSNGLTRKYRLASASASDDDDESTSSTPFSMLGISLTWNQHEQEQLNSMAAAKQQAAEEDSDSDGNDEELVDVDVDAGPSNRRQLRALVETADDDEPTSTMDDAPVPSGAVGTTMTTHLVRGMPYATMEYEFHGDNDTTDDSLDEIVPSLTSADQLAENPKIDQGSTTLECGDMDSQGHIIEQATPVLAKSEIVLHFQSSDFTWAVFLSKPAHVSCYQVPQKVDQVGLLSEVMFQLFVEPLDSDDDGDDDADNTPFVLRTALVDECTTGQSNVNAHCDKANQMKGDTKEYLDLLRKHVRLYPRHPKLSIDYQMDDFVEEGVSDPAAVGTYTFDWDVQSFGSSTSNKDDEDDLLMFALPHHQRILDTESTPIMSEYCKPSFHGSTCLVQGSSWRLAEPLGQPLAFTAPRPPQAFAIPTLAKALKEDINYLLPPNLHRAAADTYFPGKILARMGRVLLIARELMDLANQDVDSDFIQYADDVDQEWIAESIEAAKKASLPTEKQFAKALKLLEKGVQVWIDGTGEAQFLYDSTWGGLVNCGCRYTAKDATGYCNNTFPDCPALDDVNKDFGNGFYNDHHFHYGYHLYGAAVAAKLDPEWGRSMFDRLMLYVRDIANPNDKDPYFPLFRQKDWWLGSSWASGLYSMNTVHGRNQESSSESIAAYEAVTLFGQAMEQAFADSENEEKRLDAQQVRIAGRLLTAMEVSATQRYWHVWNSTTHNNTYPSAYTQPVVGMLYETQASFQTWFDGGDMASIGIQLLPFTPVSESRDDPEWASLVYPPYKESCLDDHQFCVKNGWSVMLSGLKATIGDRKGALKDVLNIPVSVFESEGGNGHTRSNLVWFVATRPDVPLQTKTIEKIALNDGELHNPEEVKVDNANKP